MPAIYDSLVHRRGLTSHVAWRVSFIVPFILITGVAIAMLLFAEDTPTGKWADRGNVAAPADSTIVAAPGNLAGKPSAAGSFSSNDEKKVAPVSEHPDVETRAGVVQDIQILDEVQHEVVVKPSFKVIIEVACSLQSIMLMSSYVCSFGGELAINSILGYVHTLSCPSLHPIPTHP